MRNHINPGALVNDLLGTSAIAERLRLNRTTVWRWGQKVPVGTGGIVPARYHADLLSFAHQSGERLTADDLVHGRTI